jgi:hypothetical protein
MKRPWSPVAASTVIATFAVVLLMAPLAPAQVFQHVPSDALVVFQVKDLQATSKKLGDLSQKLGIAQMSPDAGDPLAAFKKKMNLEKGLDETKDAGFYLPNQELKKDQKPQMVVLLPVSDYKAFLENFENPKTQGDVTVIKLPDNPDDSYVVNWDNYAAIGTTADSVSKKPDGLTPQGQAAKQIDSKDMVFFVNMKSARTRLLPEIQKGRAKVLADFDKQMHEAAAKQGGQAEQPGEGAEAQAKAEAEAIAKQAQQFAPLMKAGINRAMDVVEQVVTDSDAATWGVQFSDTGMKPGWMLEFAQGSPSAQKLSQFKGTDQPLLSGLPQLKYLFFGGMSFDGKAAAQLIKEFAAPLEQQIAALGPQAQPIQQYLSAAEAMTNAFQSSSMGFVTPSGALGQDAIFQFVGINHGDAKAMGEAQRQMFDSQQAMMQTFMPAQAKAQVKTTFTANARTVDGVTLNKLSTSFATPAGQQPNPQQAQMQQMMSFLYGPGGMNVLSGAVNDNTLISAEGVNDQNLSKLIASAKAGQDVLKEEASFKPTEQELPNQRLGAFYVQLDQIATTIATYAKAFGMPVNFQLPPDLSPVGIAISTQGSALEADGFVPTQTIQSIVAAGMQTYMQMQGGNGAGGEKPAGGGL